MSDPFTNNEVKQKQRQSIQDHNLECLTQGGEIESLPSTYKTSNTSASQLWHKEPLLLEDDLFN